MHIKKFLRTYFVFSRKERNAAIFFSLVIAVLLIAPGINRRFFIRNISVNSDSLAQVFAWQKKVVVTDGDEMVIPSKGYYTTNKYYNNKFDHSDSVATITQAPDAAFLADTVSADQWKSWGISPAVAVRIVNYLNKGGQINSGEDLKKIYGITDKNISVLSPWIAHSYEKKIPYDHANITMYAFHPQKSFEINSVTEKDLINMGMAPGFAQKLISTRDGVGGFYSADQLDKIYGLDTSVIRQMKTYVTIDEKKLKKINLNTASLEQLEKHTYISDALARSIIDYRNATGRFASVSELMNVPGIYPALFEKLKPYLTI